MPSALSTPQLFRLASLVGTDISSGGVTTGELALAGGAILAIGAMGILIGTAINDRLSTIAAQRTDLEKMIKNDFSIYFIPDDEHKRTGQDKCVLALANIFQALANNPNYNLLLAYSHIEKHEITNDQKTGSLFSVRFSRPHESEQYLDDQSNDDVDELTDARKSLHSFLTTEGLAILKLVNGELDKGLLTDTRLLFEPGTFLTEVNATRTILLALLSVARYLAYPMNPQTKVSVDWKEAIVLCEMFKKILSDLQSESHKNELILNRHCLYQYAEVKSFVGRLDGVIAKLKDGFEASLKHQLNLKVVTDHAFLLLQTVNLSLHSLLYRNEEHSQNLLLIEIITQLNDSIEKKPEYLQNLTKKLVKLLSEQTQSKFNFNLFISKKVTKTPSPNTVMDLLAVFSHVPENVRKKALAQLKQETQLEAQFHRNLLRFDTYFIKPIEDKLNPSFLIPFVPWLYPKTHLSVAKTCLMAWVVLVFGASNDILMTTITEDNANLQLRKINERMITTNASKFNLDYLKYLGLSDEILNLLQTVIRAQCQMIPAARQMHGILTLTKRNEHFLLDPSIKQFIDKRLHDLDLKRQAILDAVTVLSSAAQAAKGDVKVESETGQVLLILSNLKDLNANLDCSVSIISSTLEASIKEARKIIKKDTFDKDLQQKELNLVKLIQELDNVGLFNSQVESNQFFNGLGDAIKNKTITQGHDLETESPEGVSISSGSTDGAASHQSAPQGGVFSPGPREPIELSCAFQMQALAQILAIGSAIVLIIGLLVLLLMTFGVHYIPIVAALIAPVAIGLTIAGFVSAASGGLGLATSYYVAKFFKEVPNPPTEALDVKLDDVLSQTA